MSGYTDWQDFAERIIRTHGVKSVLEFGLGEGTRMFLNMCDKVKSVEFLATDEHRDWLGKCKADYSEFKNWEVEPVETKDEWNPIIVDAMKRNVKGFDLIFVDPGIHCRGKMVDMLLDIAPKAIIMAHDTAQGDEDEHYGWKHIREWENKELYMIGQGTTAWFPKK